MGFPQGMQLSTIAFGIPMTITGKDVTATVTVKPTSRVIWAATGQPIPEFSDSFTAAAGELGQFQVPAIDQPGFIDSTGAAVTDFAYQITGTWSFGNERPIPWAKNLKPMMGQIGPIDLDLVPDGPVSLPVTAPTAAVLGFNGRTGFITLQDSDLPTRLSVEELSATIDTQIIASPTVVGKANKNQATVLPASNIVGFCGDSITNAAGASSQRGYIHLVRWISGTRNVDQVYRLYATSGYTSTQILATHVPAACSGDAGVVHVAWGTNDAGQATPVTVATFAANTIEAHRQITAAGKKMTISLIPPRGSIATAAWRKDRAAYNEWINTWAPLANVPVADTNTLLDPATGHLKVAYDSGDGTHPNDAGHAKLAEAVSATVLKAVPVQPHRQVKSPDVNLVSNGTIGTSPAAGLPTGWSETAGGTGTAPTYSTVADSSGTLKEGLWLEMDFDATAAGGTRAIQAGYGTKGTNFAAGDQIEVSARLQFVDVAGYVAAIEAGTATASLRALNTGGGITNIPLDSIRSAAPGRIAYRFAAPDTTYPLVQLQIVLPTGVRVRARLGEVLVRNLTSLALIRPTA